MNEGSEDQNDEEESASLEMPEDPITNFSGGISEGLVNLKKLKV